MATLGSVDMIDRPDFVLKFVHEDQTDSALIEKRKSGDVLSVYHGSPLSNWYSILYNSFELDCCSDMSLFGKGIYFSVDGRVSRSFAPFDSLPPACGHLLPFESKRIQIVGVFDIDTTAARSGEVLFSRSASSSQSSHPRPRGAMGFGEANLPDQYVLVRASHLIRITHLLIYANQSLGERNIMAAKTFALWCRRMFARLLPWMFYFCVLWFLWSRRR
jgi:hypothetical protein